MLIARQSASQSARQSARPNTTQNTSQNTSQNAWRLAPQTASGTAVFLAAVCMVCLAFPLLAMAKSSERTLVRIGTGGDGGTYYPIGTLIAEAITEHDQPALDTNSRGVLAVSQRSTGSQANIADIGDGLLEAGLAQADVVHWAYNAAGPFAGLTPNTNLRTVATLYFESVHLVVHRDSGIDQISDLAGRRVSVDELGSGTRLNIPYVLGAYGIDTSQMNTVYLKPVDAMDRLRRNKLDAFFIVAGYPIDGVAALVEDGIASILPIGGENIQPLLQQYPFFTIDRIPANTYADSAAVATLAVPAQLIVDASLADDLVYKITQRLWQPKSMALLTDGHPKGKDVRFDSAINGLSAPLHAGAERYYREKLHGYFEQ